MPRKMIIDERVVWIGTRERIPCGWDIMVDGRSILWAQDRADCEIALQALRLHEKRAAEDQESDLKNSPKKLAILLRECAEDGVVRIDDILAAADLLDPPSS